MSLLGKTALITGGSRGIGRAISEKLSSLGANILINYAGNDTEAKNTQKFCQGLGVRAEIFKADVGDFDQCQAMFEYVKSELSEVDILINNAGITKDNLIMRMSSEEFDDVISVNLKGVFNCTKLACRSMIKKRNGRIVNISSVVGLMGNAGQANYAASKAGVIGMTKASAREFAARGITVNSVAPGFIKTDMTDILSDSVKDSLLSQIPQGRFGTGEDIAGAVAFLCSEQAAYITGQVINVNGGMIMP